MQMIMQVRALGHDVEEGPQQEGLLANLFELVRSASLGVGRLGPDCLREQDPAEREQDRSGAAQFRRFAASKQRMTGLPGLRARRSADR